MHRAEPLLLRKFLAVTNVANVRFPHGFKQKRKLDLDLSEDAPGLPRGAAPARGLQIVQL
jgi:hypothetical protein